MLLHIHYRAEIPEVDFTVPLGSVPKRKKAAVGKDIPEPGAKLTTEQKMLYRNLLMQSGNHEMQKYNTGIAGYKLEKVGSIIERIGDIASHRMFLGGSKLVHS